MSMEARSSSALFKRAEQLRRWEESETNRESTVVPEKSRKIKFSADCVFLAACAAGDKEEVLRLLEQGAVIDTVNVDGLSALHQACIDDNLDMVEFLVKHGADVNKGDNEGWTPLHATASCGFISIAKFLIEHGANVASVNNDGELPVDIAESDEMEDMLQQHIDEQGIDCDEARNEEERMMLKDAREWLAMGEIREELHSKTRASALHVAAAKGYINVIELLLQAGADVDTQDADGWTPLHAAAHWGQKESCEMLIQHMCDMDTKNLVGQTAFDVADSEMVKVLEELRKKQESLRREKGDLIINKRHSQRILEKAKEKERQMNEENTPIEIVPQVQLKIQPEPSEDSRVAALEDEESDDDDTSDSLDSSYDDDDDDSLSYDIYEEEKNNRVNRDEQTRIQNSTEVAKQVPITPAPSSPPKQGTAENDDSVTPSWRRPGSFRSRGGGDLSNKTLPLRIGENEPAEKITSPTGPPRVIAPEEKDKEIGLRRTQSFEADEKFYRRYLELRAKINAGTSCPTLHPPHTPGRTPTRSASLKEKCFPRRGLVREDTRLPLPPSTPALVIPPTSTTTSPSATTPTSSPSSAPSTPTSTSSPQSHPSIRSGVMAMITGSPLQTPTTPTTPGGSKLSPGNIFKNFFKSFVPPVRDEESETQRKAHAKRVRETRRSTQGVTLEEIKSAEQLVKKKQQQQLQQATQQLSGSDQSPDSEEPLHITATITTAEPTVAQSGERRPSWRLRVDNGSKFMLEDARTEPSRASAPALEAALRRPSVTTTPRPASDPADTSVTLPLRRPSRPPDDKDQDKENDIRNAQATQAVIQRRRRPKRRSTGVVHVDMDEIDPDRQDNAGGVDGEDVHVNNTESGTERSGRSSRLSSSTDGEATANGEIDYKKLYEESQQENERLREKLKKTEEDLKESKTQAEKNASPGKNSMSEMEKRERRALERKLSEMEEELKLIEKLKCENQKLKDENGALIRVISKLSK
ncbi:protein phosphatase 1 regulatory subunit 12B-like isoform X3 [Macrosteles quadrilineatus]|uniref:protein phosphatase 1 regulatory subunit 12B-like isoform X3 n=1 Tax=Macrosteles quadrilineatus TaxID=74068 RepID=UPI0023E15037|nr:protein phosphatase 1 regulatory subunit 12B-like isoform X3 [Macrosteles quadrilineatus]